MLMHAIVQGGGVGGRGGGTNTRRECTESWLRENSLATSGSQTGVSSTAEWCWAKWAASLPCLWKQFPCELCAVCDVRCCSVSGGGEESLRQRTGPWGCPCTDRDSDATGTAQYRHCQVHPEAFPTQPENVGIREFCRIILVQFPPSPRTQSPLPARETWIQTHKRFKQMLIYYDIDSTMQIFREIPKSPSSGHKTALKQQWNG